MSYAQDEMHRARYQPNQQEEPKETQDSPKLPTSTLTPQEMLDKIPKWVNHISAKIAEKPETLLHMKDILEQKNIKQPNPTASSFDQEFPPSTRLEEQVRAEVRRKVAEASEASARENSLSEATMDRSITPLQRASSGSLWFGKHDGKMVMIASESDLRGSIAFNFSGGDVHGGLVEMAKAVVRRIGL